MTQWTYVLVLDDTIARQEAVTLVDRLDCVKNWYACLGHALFIISDESASALTAQLRPTFGTRRFLVLDASTDRSGWLPQQAWEFFKKAKREHLSAELRQLR